MKYLAFDIETTKTLPPHDYDRKSHRPLGISCAATFLSGADEPVVWHGGVSQKRAAKRINQRELHGLVDYLETKVKCGYKIVTWNGLGFDFDILAEE